MSGDLINKPGDTAQIAEYLRVTHEIDAKIPVYHVAGNHDVGNIPTHESLEAYRSLFGKDYYSFRNGDMEGIVIDSSIIQHPEKVMDEEKTQREWLATGAQGSQGERSQVDRTVPAYSLVFYALPMSPINTSIFHMMLALATWTFSKTQVYDMASRVISIRTRKGERVLSRWLPQAR
jgi:3',5'-cyclic AMP phosphodiesterase CpdA